MRKMLLILCLLTMLFPFHLVWADGLLEYDNDSSMEEPNYDENSNMLADGDHDYIDELNNHDFNNEYNDENDVSASSTEDDYTCFFQTDSRWKDVKYGYSNTSGTTQAYIGKGAGGLGSGCGLVSLTNAVYALNGVFLEPADLAAWSLAHNCRINGIGTTHNFPEKYIAAYGEAIGVRFDGDVGTVNSTVKNHILNGGVAVINVVGHFACLVDYDSSSGKYLALDSAPTESRMDAGTGKVWLTENQLKTHSKWAVSAVHLLSRTNSPGLDILPFRTPITCYPVSEGNITTYRSATSNEAVGYITGSTDQCVINTVYINGRASVTYPTPNGPKTAYANMNEFIPDAWKITNYRYTIDSNTPVYRRNDLSQTIGTAFPEDDILAVAEFNGKTQVIYPFSGGYKMGWIDGSVAPGPSPSSDIDSRYPVPIKTYTNSSGNVDTYSSVNGSKTGAIYPEDLCTISEIYTNGWCMVSYPTGNGTKTAYTPFSYFLDTGSQVSPGTFQPDRTLKVYARRDLSQALGSVWSSDSCTIVASAGDLRQVIYPLDAGGYKMGWISLTTTHDTIDWPMPLKCYIDSSSERASVYQEINQNAGYGQIFVEDLCTINEVYKNGWVNVTYPTSKGSKTGYVPLSVFVPNSIDAYSTTSSKQITSYRKSNMAETFGYASQGDPLIIVGKSSGKLQMIYPLDSGGNKLAWAYESDFSKVLSSVSISSKPSKTVYIEGQSLDLSGLKVTASYSDHSSATVTNYTVSGYSATPGEKTVTVSYTENGVTKTAVFSVTVSAKKPTKLTLTKAPSRTTYLEGMTDFDFSDLVVTAIYDNGTSSSVSGYELFGLSSERGTHIITVKYTENGQTVSTSFAITVKARSLVTIYPIYGTDESEIFQVLYGEELNPEIVRIGASYDNGDYEVLSDYSVQGFDRNKTGVQTVTISYGGKTTEATVNVVNPGPVENVMTAPDIRLPEETVAIEDEAFRRSNARWIRLGENVEQIGNYAFADCMNLSQIYIPETTGWISKTAFSGVKDGFTIYGISGSYAEYYAGQNGFAFMAI